MSDSLLVGYATRYGSTREVAEAVAQTLRDEGLTVDCRPVKEVKSLAGYGAVVTILIPALKQMPVSDIRDWPAIRAWAGGLVSALRLDR